MRPARRRRLSRYLVEAYQVSERRSCRALPFHRSTVRYQSRARDQTPIRIRLRDLAASRVRYGYRRLHVLLRREGWKVNHKRIWRLYKEEGLEVRTKKRRKRVSALRVVLPAATAPNERWSMDFMADSLHDGRRFRILTLVDHVSRVSPAIEVGSSIPGRRVVAMLEKVSRTHGLPRAITTDNGTEFTCRTEDFGRSAWSSTGLSRWRTRRRRSRRGGSTTMSTGRIPLWATERPGNLRLNGSYLGPGRREFFNPKIGPKKGAVPEGYYTKIRVDQSWGAGHWRRLMKTIPARGNLRVKCERQPQRWGKSSMYLI